jgi:uncharacterized DUF497 family protein
MHFEWDENKNTLNKKNHGVSFEQAQEVFEDPFQISKLDFRFNYLEERWITLGSTKDTTILVVANLFFTDDGEEIIRIISARKANTKEVTVYETY